jgi:hypothetical protein
MESMTVLRTWLPPACDRYLLSRHVLQISRVDLTLSKYTWSWARAGNRERAACTSNVEEAILCSRGVTNLSRDDSLGCRRDDHKVCDVLTTQNDTFLIEMADAQLMRRARSTVPQPRTVQSNVNIVGSKR